jgi:RNA polymerase sigma-70 factor (sigma-E family)
MTAAEPGDVAGRSSGVSRPAAARAGLGSVAAQRDAEAAVTALYTAHYRTLVGLAALLVRDTGTAEEVVQDSFVALHRGWRRLRDNDKALAYLRQSVLNRSRSVLRRRAVADRYTPRPEVDPGAPSAEQGAMALLERSAVVAALLTLSARQREAVVLQYYAGLSGPQAAQAMGISASAVKNHTARAMASLRSVLERPT